MVTILVKISDNGCGSSQRGDPLRPFYGFKLWSRSSGRWGRHRSAGQWEDDFRAKCDGNEFKGRMEVPQSSWSNHLLSFISFGKVKLVQKIEKILLKRLQYIYHDTWYWRCPRKRRGSTFQLRTSSKRMLKVDSRKFSLISSCSSLSYMESSSLQQIMFY